MGIPLENQQLQHRDDVHGNAPWLTIPHGPIVGIEHPFLIADISKAVDTLGSSRQLEKLVGKTSAFAEVDLRLHPGDRNSKPIASFNSQTNNILLKITVPKRTGRKRKRGSDKEWQHNAEASGSGTRLLSDPQDARRLVRSMRDNPNRYEVDPIGAVKQTHRFRGLPDFVWSTERSPFMTKMKKHILPFDYTKLKNFTFDMSKGIQEENEIVPPPRWANQTIPFNYSYRQNPAVQQILSDKGATYRNTQAPQRNKIPMVPYDIVTVPTNPPDDITPESLLPDCFQDFLAAVREILLLRPVCTRRFLQNQIPPDIWKRTGVNSAKYMWQYVGFIWNSGPWRDSICALGVDPRKVKEMRWYQTVVFHLEPEPGDTRLDKTKVSKTRVDRKLAATGKNREGHLFDGKTVGLDGKVWQLGDITDPLLRGVLQTNTLRDACHEMSDGWYPNGIMAKVRVVMKAKMHMILAGNGDDAEQNDELVRLCQTVPDVITPENRSQTIFNNASKRMLKLAEQVRSSVRKLVGGSHGAWIDEVKDQQPRKQRRGGVKGDVRYKSPRGGPSRGRGSGRKAKARDADAAVEEQDVLDPRLRAAVSELEDEAVRQGTMRAFEDASDGSNDDSDDDDSATSDVSEEEEEEMDDEDDGDDEDAAEDTEPEKSR
ncbi:MAG: hypothetical protein Q9213_003933 [Squamulea squamosa]